MNSLFMTNWLEKKAGKAIDRTITMAPLGVKHGCTLYRVEWFDSDLLVYTKTDLTGTAVTAGAFISLCKHQLVKRMRDSEGKILVVSGMASTHLRTSCNDMNQVIELLEINQ